MNPTAHRRPFRAGYLLLLLVMEAQLGLGLAYGKTPEAAPQQAAASADDLAFRRAEPLTGALLAEQRVSPVPAMAERAQPDREPADHAGNTWASGEAPRRLSQAAPALLGRRVARAVHLYDVLCVYRL